MIVYDSMSCPCTTSCNFAHMLKLLWQKTFTRSSAWPTRPVHLLSKRNSIAMEHIVSVRRLEGEERLQISLKYAYGKDDGRIRTFNFDRPKSEELQLAFERIANNISKVVLKVERKKKKKASISEEAAKLVDEEVKVAVNLLHNGERVDASLPNVRAWIEGATFEVGERKYEVRVNLPNIRSMSLADGVMAGFPVYPKIDAEFVNLEQSQFIWYREKPRAEPDYKDHEQAARKKQKQQPASQSEIDCEEVGKGYCYIPSNSDIGCRLRVECIPVKGDKRGEEKDAWTKHEVTAGPGLCPFENRHQHTKTPAGIGQFRVMTYNVLADCYADSEYTREYLYPYCPAYALTFDYRKQLLLKEIIGYNADVICLQEVDRKLFVHDLSPTLETHGFEGFLKLKAGEVREGCATFFRKSKFRFVAQHDLHMAEALKEDELFKDLVAKINSNDLFKEKVMERTTTMQMTVLESLEAPGQKLAVLTTHLFFHPRAPHVRVLQTAVCLMHMERVLRQYSQDDSVAVIFCGDFNSYPEGGVHQLIHEKCIPGHHADWYAGGKMEFVEGMELSHNLNLTSACGFPRYTNFVSSFSGCIDYIYISEELRTHRVIPMPTHKEVTEYTALPNVVFPSDHLALICDLEWTNKTMDTTEAAS